MHCKDKLFCVNEDVQESNATKKAHEEINNSASHAKQRTSTFSKLHIILHSYLHNTDLINIIIIRISVERHYVAPSIVQREKMSEAQRKR